LDYSKENIIYPLSPAGRLARPEGIAKIVLFIAGESASYINGSSIVVDGWAIC